MKINLIKTTEITDYENEIGRELVVNERRNPRKGLEPYYVHFDGCEVIEQEGFLSSISGDGITIDKAIADYAKRISCKKLVFGAYSGSRREVLAPKLIHTKFLEKKEGKKRNVKKNK